MVFVPLAPKLEGIPWTMADKVENCAKVLLLLLTASFIFQQFKKEPSECAVCGRDIFPCKFLEMLMSACEDNTD